MLKVISYDAPEKIPYTNEKPYTCTNVFHWRVRSNIRGEKGYIHFFVTPGHKVDGSSVPWPVNKLKAFKNWYGATDKDLAGIGHDILYMLKGEIDNLGIPLDPGECDDYYRGMKREDGFERWEASIQDLFLNFAHNSRHWGNDSFGVKDTVKVSWEPTDET